MTSALRPLAVLLALGLALACGQDRTAGVEARLELSPRVLDFGAQAPGTSTLRKLTLTNPGRLALDVTAHVEDDARLAFRGGGKLSVASGGSAGLEVRYFALAAEGVDNARLVVSWNGADEYLSLTGRSVAAPPPDAGPPDAGPTPDAGFDAGVDGGLDGGHRPSWDGGNSTCFGASRVRQLDYPLAAYANHQAAVWNGTGWLSMFSDTAGPTTFAMHVERLDALGNVVAGTRVDLPMEGTYPHAVWTGNGYGLVYARFISSSPFQREVRFVRLDAQGQVVPGTDVAVAPGTSLSQDLPSVVWNPIDSEFGVAWWEFNSANAQANEFAFRRVSASGVPLGTKLELSGGAAYFGTRPGSSLVVFTGQVYAGAWSEGNQLLLGRIERNGTLRGRSTIASLPAGSLFLMPALAFSGTEYAVVYEDVRAGNLYAFVSAARAAADGSPLGTPLQLTPVGAWSPGVVWTGSEFLATWFQGQSAALSLWSARISGGVEVSGSKAPLSCGGSDVYGVLEWNGQLASVGYITNANGQRHLLVFPP